MTGKTVFLSILFIFLIIVSGAQAEGPTIQAMNTNSYSVTANPGYYIYQIVIDGLPLCVGSPLTTHCAGTNQTHVLTYNGATFLLSVNTWTDYGIWRNADVSLTYPNGTVSTSHTSVSSVAGSYKTIIQPVFTQLQSGSIVFLTVDLNIGLAPTVQAGFAGLPNWQPSSAIPFTSASGSFSQGQTSNVFCEQISTVDFTNKISNYDALYGATTFLQAVLAWSWNGIIAFLNMIPVIGPLLITVISFVGDMAGEFVFWIVFVAVNIWQIIAGGELLIALMAFLLCAKKPTPEKFVKKWVSYNVRVVTGFVWGVTTAYNKLLLPLATLVARLIK